MCNYAGSFTPPATTPEKNILSIGTGFCIISGYIILHLHLEVVRPVSDLIIRLKTFV